MKIDFCKFHGFGNDYIVIENEQLKGIDSINEFAERICHRHHGAGSDGIAVLEKLDGKDADYNCRIINPDGSEGSFSGNGTRCAVAYLYFKNLWSDKNLRLSTLSGLKKYTLLKEDGKTFWFLGELGKSKFSLEEIPFVAEEKISEVKDYDLAISTGKIRITALNPGNPVAAIFVENFDAFDWRKTGREIEVHPQFPERANVVFIKPVDDKNIEIRIWERGAGETSSSGTCSAAAAIAHLWQKDLRGLVNVHAEGGTTEITWREDGEMIIKGRADFSYCGEWTED